MKYKAIFTHNPQDFFEGAEPFELCQVLRFEPDDEAAFREILSLVDEGYKAVITMGGDSPDG